MNDALRPLVTAIDHVGIAVPDLDAAIEFHRVHFGLEVALRERGIAVWATAAGAYVVGSSSTLFAT